MTAEELAAQVIEREFGVSKADWPNLKQQLATAFRTHGEAEYARGFEAGQEAMRERTVKLLRETSAWMDPPDGGDPTRAEMIVNARDAIRALPVEPAPSPRSQSHD